jgi:acyl carrier protein
MEQLYEILESNVPTVDFRTADRLITDKIIDSIDLVSIIADIEDAFGVSINIEDIDPVNFDSAQAIWNLINSLK